MICRGLQGWTFAAALFAGVTPISAETALGWRRQPGEVDSQKITQRMQMDAYAPDKKEPFTTSIEQSCVLESAVSEVAEDGDVEVNQNFSQIGIALRIPEQIGKTIVVDTGDPELADDPIEAVLFKSISKILGLNWLVRFDRQGVVQEVALSEELRALFEADQAVSPLLDTFTASGLRRVTEQSVILLPERPVEQGDQWEQTVSQPLAGGQLTTKRVCRYVGAGDDGLERIAVTMTATFQPPKETRFPTELMKNDGRGEVLFDPKLGRIVRSSFTQDLELQVGFDGRKSLQKLKITTKLEPAPPPPPKPQIDEKE